MTPLPGMSIARSVRVARPFLMWATPSDSGLKSLTYDSPARATRSSAAPTSGGSCAEDVVAVHVVPFKLNSILAPTAAVGQVWEITASDRPGVATSTSQVMESSVEDQPVKYEQLGARALRRTLPCGTPSRAGSVVIGNWA